MMRLIKYAAAIAVAAIVASVAAGLVTQDEDKKAGLAKIETPTLIDLFIIAQELSPECFGMIGSQPSLTSLDRTIIKDWMRLEGRRLGWEYDGAAVNEQARGFRKAFESGDETKKHEICSTVQNAMLRIYRCYGQWIYPVRRMAHLRGLEPLAFPFGG